MTASALDGLAALLDKNPIIPTFKARDFLTLAADIEVAYQRHVRTYLPLAQGSGGDEAADVGAFEGRLFRLIREGKAPTGYVAAEYGHGKTSTGLFLWERARAANVLAVPPFSLDRLEDLITAVAGWARFAVERVAPGLGAEVDAVYQTYRAEGVEALARRHASRFERPYEQVLAEFRALNQQGQLQSAADGLTYVNFLDAITAIAKRAGFEGLLVVADEVQQYIEHADVSSAAEPISRLFDLITTMLSRTGRLACGLILLLPNKELGLLNQQRGDLVQRIKANRLAIDLTQVYGPSFATDLWQRLAEEFHFQPIAERVIDPDALRALGEIAARTDLASGPRTVVDVLKLAATRARAGGSAPFGLLDLVGAFEHGEVAFDGLSRIQSAVRQALGNDLVRGHPERERAVRLMAAFPTTGLSLPLQSRAGVRDAVDDLQRLAGGELVAIRGGGYDHTGRAIEAGVTLIDLRPTQEQVNWLKATIRNFRRVYYLHSEGVHRLAARGFLALLTERLFPASAWREDRQWESTALSQNAGLLLRGAFPSTARRFPDRVVCCRILRPNEPPHDPLTAPDLQIDIALQAPLDSEVEAQRAHPGSLHWLAPNHVRIELNLLRREPDAVYLDLNPGFEDIVAPYDVNPMLNLSLYAHLAHALHTGAVPGAEESNVRDLFLPALHTAALRDLLTAEVGQHADPPVTAADTRFVEALVQAMCERTYGDRYHTLMVTGAWRKALEEYKGALQKLNNPFIQNGNEPYSGTKKEVASLLTRTNATLDNFIQMFPQLIKVETAFRGDAAGAVRFTLHPLEQRIIALVQAGDRIPRLNKRTGQAVEAPTLKVSEVYPPLAADGYRPDEIKAGLDLLEARHMIDWDQRVGLLALAEPDVPPLDIVRAVAAALAARMTTLRPVLTESFVRLVEQDVNTIQRALNDTNRRLDGRQLLLAKRQIDQISGKLEVEIAVLRREVGARVSALLATGAEAEQLDRPLASPTATEMFGGQLGVVRSLLHEQSQTLAKQTEQARSVVRQAELALRGSVIDDAGLAAVAVQVTQSDAALGAIHQGREALRRRFDDYQTAAQVLDQARELREAPMPPSAATSEDPRAAIGRWAAEITGQLSAERIDALVHVSAWQAQLAAIRQQLSAHQHSLRDAFVARQTALRAILSEELRVGSHLVPPPLVFNPADPAESERLLVASIRSVLEDSRDRALRAIENVAADARDPGRSQSLMALEPAQRELAIQEMREVEQRCRQVATEVASAFASVIDELTDLDPREVKERLRAAVAPTNALVALMPRVAAVKRLLQEVELTPEEQQAHDLLSEMAGDQEIDFGAFQQRLAERLPAADPWLLLRALTEKSRVRPRMQIIKR